MYELKLRQFVIGRNLHHNRAGGKITLCAFAHSNILCSLSDANPVILQRSYLKQLFHTFVFVHSNVIIVSLQYFFIHLYRQIELLSKIHDLFIGFLLIVCNRYKMNIQRRENGILRLSKHTMLIKIRLPALCQMYA